MIAMSPKEYVLLNLPDARLVVEHTRQGTRQYCIQSDRFPARPGRGVSAWCFSEDDAWASAERTIFQGYIEEARR